MFKRIIRFFDHLEDTVRISLSHYPIAYSFVGAVGIVLFWRGVWMMADELMIDSVSSVTISLCLLLSTGLFVSFFIGDDLIMSGLRREKKLVEMTEEEVEDEAIRITKIEKKLVVIEKLLREQIKENKQRDRSAS